MSLHKKVNGSSSCFDSLPSLHRSRGFQIVLSAELIWTLSSREFRSARKIWQNLYLRSYLRNGDLFALSLRLIILSLTALIFIEQSWIAVAIVILFNYLLLFQLLALYHAFDYQYLTQLFPVGKGQKEKGLKEILRSDWDLCLNLGKSR